MNTATEITEGHYQRPEVKEIILKLCSYAGGLRGLNGDEGWYSRGPGGSVKLRGPGDYDDTTARARCLYMTADVFDPMVFDLSASWIEGRGGEGRPSFPLGTRGDLISYSLFADIDATKDPGETGSKLYHPGRIEALEAAASFMVQYLGERGISESVGVLFSGQGIYVWIHPGLSDVSENRALPDFDRQKQDDDFKVWMEAFNALLYDIETAFFEAFPGHVGRVKFDKLNNQKRKIKCLLSIHKTLPFAVVPLNKDDIKIDLEESRVTLDEGPREETITDAGRWLDNWKAAEGERGALTALLKPYAAKAQKDISRKANASDEINREPEPVPVVDWCPFYQALATFPGGGGSHRVCGALAAWLYQAGWEEGEAFDLWYDVAARCDVETRIFYTSYGVINSPSCRTIQKTSAGYPSLGFGGLNLCDPNEKCAGCRWPGDYGTDRTEEARDFLETAIEGIIEDKRKLKDREVLAAILTLRTSDPIEFEIVADRLRDAKAVTKPTLKKLLDSEVAAQRADRKKTMGEKKTAPSEGCGTEGGCGDTGPDVHGLDLSDFGYEIDDELCGPKFVFSRSMAAAAINSKMKLAMTPISKSIHFFDGEIYSTKGEAVIKDTTYTVCGDYVGLGDLIEVIDRVKAGLSLNPVDLKPDPCLMPLTNGVIDLRTGELLNYTAEMQFTFKYNAAWDPEGGDWKRVMWHLCSSLPDPRDVLQAIDIMTATAVRLPFDAWVLLIGGGNNGKGMFERLLLNFVTRERSSAPTLDELKRSQFASGHLLNVDLLLVSEVESVKDANSVLKKLATGEFMDSDVKYATSRAKGSPHVMTVLDANAAFDYGDDSFGRKRRTLKLDFPFTFGEGPNDRPIDRNVEALFKTPGIMSGVAWIIAARAPSLIASRKIYRHKSAEEVDAEFERQRNSLHYFTEECLGALTGNVDGTAPWIVVVPELGETAGKRLSTAKAHELYLEWCRRFNVPTPASIKHLTGYIKKKFNTETAKSVARSGGERIDYRYFDVVGLVKTPAEAVLGLYLRPPLPGRRQMTTSQKLSAVTSAVTKIAMGEVPDGSDGRYGTRNRVSKGDSIYHQPDVRVHSFEPGYYIPLL